ncbi:MAG: hypothetical protein KA764_19560, partial [Anaerolineales bacterium]|nr:hypothetical protein [Anaerolineales bacterium]
ITALFPLPDHPDPAALRVFFSFGAVQGLLDPITPLGQDALRSVIAGAAHVLGYADTYETQDVFYLAGERVWVDITGVLRNHTGRRVARGALSFVEPSVGQAIAPLLNDPRLSPTAHGLAPRTALRVGPRLLVVLSYVLRYLANPEGRRLTAQREVDAYLADLRARSQTTGDAPARLAQRVALLTEMTQAFPLAIPRLATGLAAGMAAFNLLRLASRPGLDRAVVDRLTLEATRGLPHNVTTQMDLQLWATARLIRAAPAEAAHFLDTPAEALAAAYLAGQLPAATQRAVAAFLGQYGARGLGEIDFGRPRWREAPAPVMQALQSYLRIADEQLAPDVVFARGAVAGAAALDHLTALVRAVPGGWFRARVVGWLGRRLRALMGLRESPKFFIIRLMDILRQGLLASGQDLVTAGLLARADDLMWLRLAELQALARGEPHDWRSRVLARRALFEREKRRRQVPRVLLSDGRAIFAGLNTPASAAAGALHGDPVSPGVAEGAVRVVLDPAGAELAPGEILVCPGTDPSWTPLFLAAGGLITEVGGLMTHGSVVAREYGIPAVVGVDRATQRLRTGQRLRVDGATGEITPLA